MVTRHDGTNVVRGIRTRTELFVIVIPCTVYINNDITLDRLVRTTCHTSGIITVTRGLTTRGTYIAVETGLHLDGETFRMREVFLIVIDMSVHETETVVIIYTTEYLQVWDNGIRKRTHISTRRVSRRPVDELQVLTHLKVIILTENDTITRRTVTTELHVAQSCVAPDEETILVRSCATVTYL